MPEGKLACGRTTDEVVAFHDGELPPEAHTAFEAHLPGCEACQRALKAVSVALDGFDALVGGGPPPLDVDEALRLLHQGEARASARRAAASSRPRWLWPAIAGAALAAGVAALLALWPAAPGPGTPIAHGGPTARGVKPSPLPSVESAPCRECPPALAQKIPVLADLQGATLTLRAPRAPADRYTAVALIDSSGRPWLAQSGERPDPACAPACGPLQLEIDLAAFPPGPAEAAVIVGPAPLDDGSLYRELRSSWPPALPEARAAGHTEIRR